MRTLLTFVLAAVCYTATAQVLNQGQLIYVKNTDFSVVGDVDNLGTFINDGTLSVGGNWTNTGKYTPAAGTFILNGAVAQNIIQNKDSIFIWILNGAGEKILKDEAEVLNKLQFNTALLTTQGGAVTVRSAGTIANPSSTAYVNGLLFREGNGNKFFPVGKNGTYAPATLENIDGTPDLIIGFEVFEPNPGQAGLGVISLSTKRYWQMTRRGTGTLNGSLITLTIASDETSTPSTDVIVTEADGSNQQYRSLGQSAATATSVTSNLLITGSFFAIGLSEFLDENAIFVPNAFSPAATNPEDQAVKVYGSLLSPTDFEFQVFSKWGNLIFESRSLQEMQTSGWNGLGNEISTDASLGVYTYVMRGRFISGKDFKKNGTITVIK